MSKLEDLLKNTPPVTAKAKVEGVDKTPIDDQKFPFKDSKDLVKGNLSNARYGDLGSFSNPPAGYVPPGYGPGEQSYSKKVKK